MKTQRPKPNITKSERKRLYRKWDYLSRFFLFIGVTRLYIKERRERTGLEYTTDMALNWAHPVSLLIISLIYALLFIRGEASGFYADLKDASEPSRNWIRFRYTYPWRFFGDGFKVLP